jgi:hypothetical protein
LERLVRIGEGGTAEHPLSQKLQKSGRERGGAEPMGDRDAAKLPIQLEISDLVLELGFGGEYVAGMGTDEDGKLTTWTLGAIKNRNMAVEGYCETERCGHFYVFDVDLLIGVSGTEYLVPEYLPGIACSACGGRLKFKLAMMPPEE